MTMTKQLSPIQEIDRELSEFRQSLNRDLGHRPRCSCGVCPDREEQDELWACVDRLLDERLELVIRGN